MLSMRNVFRPRDNVDIVLREDQCGFRKGTRYVDKILTLRLVNMKCLILKPL